MRCWSVPREWVVRVPREGRMVGSGTAELLAKLTNAQANEIRDRFNRGGVTKAQLAREYGLSATGVWRVITGRSYTKETA